MCAALGKSAELVDAVNRIQIVYEAAWKSEPEMVVPLMLDLVRLLGGFGRKDTAEEIFQTLANDTAAVVNEGNEAKSLPVIDAWLRDFKRKGPNPTIGELMSKSVASLEEYFGRMTE